MQTETYYCIGSYLGLAIGVLFIISIFILIGLLVDKGLDLLLGVI